MENNKTITTIKTITKVKNELAKRQFRYTFIATVLVILIGMFSFSAIENWRLLDSLYFCVITLTTVGYGDFSPQTDMGKILTMIYICIGLGLLSSFITGIYKQVQGKNTQRRVEDFLKDKANGSK